MSKRIRQFLCSEADSYIAVNLHYGDVKITDCSRQANLWFEMDTAKHAKKSLAKLNKLLGPLLKLREALEKKIEQG